MGLDDEMGKARKEKELDKYKKIWEDRVSENIGIIKNKIVEYYEDKGFKKDESIQENNCVRLSFETITIEAKFLLKKKCNNYLPNRMMYENISLEYKKKNCRSFQYLIQFVQHAKIPDLDNIERKDLQDHFKDSKIFYKFIEAGNKRNITEEGYVVAAQQFNELSDLLDKINENKFNF